MGRQKLHVDDKARKLAWYHKNKNKLKSRKTSSKSFKSTLDHIEWTHHYCGYTWDTPYLREIVEKLWTNLKLLVFVPRGHGKTFLSIALICRYLLEHQKPVVMITSGSAQQRRLFRRIVTILNSPIIKKDYGEIIGSANFELRLEVQILSALILPGFISRISSKNPLRVMNPTNHLLSGGVAS